MLASLATGQELVQMVLAEQPVAACSDTNMCSRSAVPSPAETGPFADVLEHSPDGPGIQGHASGRYEHPAGVVPARPSYRTLARLGGPPVPERDDGHLRQLERTPWLWGPGVSARPVGAQHRHLRRVAVECDVVLQLTTRA